MAAVNSRFAVVTEEEILQMLSSRECVVLSVSLYRLTQLLSSVAVDSVF